MWNPTCYGDPGKVSDAEYKCDTDDAGGVHSNSGVPTTRYALLVDGGTYNGQTVDRPRPRQGRRHLLARADGLPDPDVGLHGPGRRASRPSCADLVGQPINKLTLAPDATSSRRDARSPLPTAPRSPTVIAATELRTEPVQCNFQPLLDPDGPGAVR